MATKADSDRKASKAKAVVGRIAEIGDSLELLIGMLDEHKLDLMILALGIGSVALNDAKDWLDPTA